MVRIYCVCYKHFNPFQAYKNFSPRTVNRHAWLYFQIQRLNKKHKIPSLLQPAFLHTLSHLAFPMNQADPKRGQNLLYCLQGSLQGFIPCHGMLCFIPYYSTLSSRSLKRSNSALLRCRVETLLYTHLAALRP